MLDLDYSLLISVAYCPNALFQNSISPQVNSVLEANQWPDQALYSHFLAKHKIGVKQFGPARMRLYVEQLSQMNEYVAQKCHLFSYSDGRTSHYTAG